MLTSPSGKSYIGQTKHSLKKRWGQHALAKNDTAISRAIAKYGKETFKVTELIIVDNALLDEYETKFIDAFRTMAPHGYNLTSGGHRPNEVSETLRERLKMNNGGDKNPFFGRKHTDEYKRYMSELSKVRAKGRWNGEKNPKYGLRGAANPKSKAVRQYAMDGAFVREYESLTAAAGALGMKASCISQAISGRIQSSGGWQWRLASDHPPGACAPRSYGDRSIRVAMCDKNGAVVRVFDTLTQASSYANVGMKTIKRSARGERTYAKIAWKFV